MKNLFKISFIILFFATSLFANPFTEPLEKVASILEKDFVKAIAVILLMICGFYVSSGNFEKGKVYAWGLIIGISAIYGAKYIIDTIWG
jgi:type IV secretory pathway VirB2 component (pilin)